MAMNMYGKKIDFFQNILLRATKTKPRGGGGTLLKGGDILLLY